jgi:hypothetical protein
MTSGTLTPRVQNARIMGRTRLSSLHSRTVPLVHPPVAEVGSCAAWLPLQEAQAVNSTGVSAEPSPRVCKMHRCG